MLPIKNIVALIFPGIAVSCTLGYRKESISVDRY